MLFGFHDRHLGISATGTLLRHINEELHQSVSHFSNIEHYNLSQYLTIDKSTQHHLDLIKLLEVVDNTETSMGKRHLKEWLLHPLLSIHQIEQRQDAISYIMQKLHHFDKSLKDINDTERLAINLLRGRTSPRELLSLAKSWEKISKIKDLLHNTDNLLLQKIDDNIKDFQVFLDIRKQFNTDPPNDPKLGNIFTEGVVKEIDTISEEIKSPQVIPNTLSTISEEDLFFQKHKDSLP